MIPRPSHLSPFTIKTTPLNRIGSHVLMLWCLLYVGSVKFKRCHTEPKNASVEITTAVTERTSKTLPGPWFNIKMSSYQYRKSHCGYKTVANSCYIHNTGKTTSVYLLSPQHLHFIVTHTMTTKLLLVPSLKVVIPNSKLLSLISPQALQSLINEVSLKAHRCSIGTTQY